MRRGTVDRVVRRLGGRGTVALRRRHSLLDPVAGTVPATLPLDGAHLAGATSVTLTAERIAGKLPPDLRLTIGGVQYSVAAVAEPAGGQLEVELASPLVADAADEAPVAIEPFRDFPFRRLFSSRTERLADGTMIRSGDQEIVLSAVAARTVPRSDDLLLIDGRPEDLSGLREIQPGDVGMGWIVTRGGRAA